MWIVSLALKWLSGGALTAIANFLTSQANNQLAKYQTGVQADTQIALAQINAEIETRKAQAQLLLADRGWWITAWVRPLFVYPCVVHFGAIVLDTVFRLHWGIPPLPSPYDAIEHSIILSFFIARPFEKVARVFTASK